MYQYKFLYVFVYFFHKACLQYFVLEQLWGSLLAGAVTDTVSDCWMYGGES